MSAPESAPETKSDARLRELLSPVLAKVAALDPGSRDTPDAAKQLEAELEAAFPFAGEHVQAIGAEIARGVDEGWLCNRGEAHARFSRLAKPTPETHDLSIDVVSLIGDAVEHTHPRGEVTIGFRAGDEHAANDDVRGGDPVFDGRGTGWVFLPPGSRHVPRVTGHRMHLIYFLPGGAVQWHM